MIRFILIFFLGCLGSPLGAQLLLVPKATNPVEIDGVIGPGEWEDAISNSSISNLIHGVVDGVEDLSGSVSFKWDADNLYFLFQITDDVRSLDSTDGDDKVLNTFDDDSIEIYLDINNRKSGGLDMNLGIYQYRFIPQADGEIERFPDNLPTDGFELASVGTDAYILEISMPWQTLKVLDPKEGDTLGFDVALNDDDDGGERDGQLLWNATGPDDWKDASKWGNILLTSPVEELEPNPIISDLPILDVFKVDNQIWISWLETDSFNYQLQRSGDLNLWQNDGRALLTTGNFRYFILNNADLEEDVFFQVQVSTTE